MRKGALALFLVLLMAGIGFVTLFDGTDTGTAYQVTYTRGVTQRLDDYAGIYHNPASAWDDYDYTEPWNQRWHNWTGYLEHYPQTEFWLRCKNISCPEPPPEITWLDDVNLTTNGEEVGFAKEDLNETRTKANPMNFTYPRADKKLTARYDTSMEDIGVLNFTINPMGQIPQFPFQNPLAGRGKEVNVEVWVDTNGDYDFILGTGTIEGIMRFDFNWWDTPYDPRDPEGTLEPHVTNNSEFYKTGRQMEEHVDGIGYWLDLDDEDTHPDIPGDINQGRIWVLLYRTDTNPDDIDGTHPVTGEPWPAWRTWDLLIYCGYEGKLSWISLPYIHPKQRPDAVVGDDMGFPENRDNFLREKSDPYHEDPFFTDNYPQIKEGEFLKLEGYRSYDPQDDVGSDGIGYGSPDWTAPDPDGSEDNGNIDNGYPEGEANLGEKDTLLYKWSATTPVGDNILNIQISGGWLSSPDYEWKIRLPAMDATLPAEDQWMILDVTLTVLDRDRLQDADTFQLLAYKSQNPPVVSISIIPQNPNIAELTKAGYDMTGFVDDAWVLPLQEITFQGRAYDPDPNSDLTYTWEFVGPFGTKRIPDAADVTEYFDEAAEWTVTLTVYDGDIDNINTLSGSATVYLHVVDNTMPIPVVRARLGNTLDWQYNAINTSKNKVVTFNGSESYDPDIQITEDFYIGLPGFDQDGDRVPDIGLKYQWDWGDGSRTEGWSTGSQAEHAWSDRGAKPFDRNFWPVKLKVWDGGENPAESVIFKVYVNMPPTAKVSYIKPMEIEEFEAGMEVTFSGEGSYDPNDDPNYDGKRDKDPQYSDRLMYTWDFGDGTPQVTAGAVINHSYKNPKLDGYNVRLVVSDGTFTDSDETTIRIAPANKAPVGVVEIKADSWITQQPAKVYTKVRMVFDASGSYDPDGVNYLDDKLETKPIDDIKSLLWDLGDGNVTSIPRVEHTYNKVGIYTVKLNMTDYKGASWDTEYTIEVTNRLPVAVVKFEKWTLNFDQQPVLLSAEGSYDEDGVIIGYYWECGDGTFSDKTKGIDGFVPGLVVPHQYEKTGSYKARLFVMDDNQEVSTNVAEVNVVILSVDDPDPVPIGTEVIVGGIAATALVLGLLSTLGLAWTRKRL